MPRSIHPQFALLPLRVVIGFGFAYHGWAKLVRGPDQFASILAAMGMPFAQLVAWTTTLLELLGGVAVMLGTFIVPLSLALGVVMATAMFGVHLRYGYSSVRLQSISSSGATFGPIGFEINLLYMAGLLTLAWSREHALSLESWIRLRAKRLQVTQAADSAVTPGAPLR